jgi:hypothetical protein
VEAKKRFPDKKKRPCATCARPYLIEVSVDLFNVFDLLALRPPAWKEFACNEDRILVQVTSRANHSTRRNKILGSMEAKLCLLSGMSILIHSWGQKEPRAPWELREEWITLADFKQAVSYPNTVAELVEIRRKEKKPDLHPGSTLDFCKGSVDFDKLPF